MTNNFKNYLTMTFSLILASLLYGIGHYLITGQTYVVKLIKHTVFMIVGASIVLLIISLTRRR